MNFLHKFLPQPCFDNAGGGGASGGGGGSTRGGRQGIEGRSGAGMDSVGNFSGGFGQNAVSGAARSGAGSREGYGYGAAGAVGRGQPARGSGLAARPASPPRATVTVAPPTRAYAPPVQTYAPPPAPVATPAPTPAPVASVPSIAQLTAHNAMSPTAMARATNASMAMVDDPSLASVSSTPAAAATVSAPSRSMSPATRSTPAQAAAARSVGQQAAAQRAGQAVSATPGGRAGGVGTPGVGGGFGPSVSNAAAKSDRGLPSVGGGGGISGGRANAGSLGGMGNAANVGLNSNVAGKSDRGVPGLNSRSDMAGLIGRQSFGGSSSMAQNNPAQSMPGSVSDLTDAQISGTIRDMIAGRQSSLFSGISPVGSFATNRPTTAAMARQEALQGLPSARGYSQPTMSATPAKAIQDRLSVASQGPTPSLGSRAVNEMVKQGVPSMRDQNFYSSDNAYEGVSFPSVNDAYPTSAAALPGGYSSTPQGSWSRNAPSFDTPMEAAQNMGLMDQMRALNMFTRGSVAPSRNDGTNRGGNSKSNTKERNRVKKAIAEAIAPKKSGWSPYTGSSRFANWTPIMKALMG